MIKSCSTPDTTKCVTTGGHSWIAMAQERMSQDAEEDIEVMANETTFEGKKHRGLEPYETPRLVNLSHRDTAAGGGADLDANEANVNPAPTSAPSAPS
jgi:hypothetical protein